MSDSVEVKSHKVEVKRAVDKQLQKAAIMIGGTVEGHAKELCPVDTGLLRNSITYAIGGSEPNKLDYISNRKDKNGNEIEAKEGHYQGRAPVDDNGQVTVYVGSNVQYAPYQELGTEKMKARPFLRPAFENFKSEIEQIIRQTLGSIR